MKTICAGCSGTIMSFFLSCRHKIFEKYLVSIDLKVYRISRNIYYLTYLRKEQKTFLPFLFPYLCSFYLKPLVI